MYLDYALCKHYINRNIIGLKTRFWPLHKIGPQD